MGFTISSTPNISLILIPSGNWKKLLQGPKKKINPNSDPYISS